MAHPLTNRSGEALPEAEGAGGAPVVAAAAEEVAVARVDPGAAPATAACAAATCAPPC